jgi:glycosyltransferase involved in cell wall biosynthesis
MKKNILYLSPSNRWLGARISLLLLLKKLDKTKFNPVIVCPSTDGPFANILEKEGFNVEYLRLWNWRKYKYFFHRASSVYKLRKLIRRHEIDLIHCNEFWTAPYAYWASIGLGIPIVSHVRLSMTPKKIHDYYLGKMTRIICVCKALVEEFSAWPDYRKRVVPIYNGVNLDEYNPMLLDKNSIRSTYNIPSDAIVIGLVGQISKRKGQDQLINIAPELIKIFPSVRFLIVGDSREMEYEKDVHQMIKDNNLKDYFVFTGKLTDMPVIYKALDILVLPSLREGFGRVVVEAEAINIPVVVSNAGGLVEVVDHGNTGFIFKLEKKREMFEYLKKLCEDPSLREKMGIAGRERVINLFSQEKMVEKATALYKEVFDELKKT